jgi:hypothetical protein
MTAFKNRFWGVKRLRIASSPAQQVEDAYNQIEPYLTWRIMALEDRALLLCELKPSTPGLKRENLIIIEGELMRAWLKHRKAGV